MNSKSPFSSSNNQQGQNMNEMENNGGSTNSNLNNNPSQTNTNQQQDFNLDDLNFDPAALIGGNGENTDLNVSIIQSYKHLIKCIQR